MPSRSGIFISTVLLMTIGMRTEVGEALTEAFNKRPASSRGRISSLLPRSILVDISPFLSEACKDSLKKLQLDCLDLYLVHFHSATGQHWDLAKKVEQYCGTL